MKLKVPVNSLQTARLQIRAGADEIYLSYDSDCYKCATFSGRAKSTYDAIKTEVPYDEFVEIIDLAHKNNVTVELAANMRRMVDDYDQRNSMQDNYIEYVRKGILAGADRVIIADIGNIILVRTTFPDIPITASVYHEVLNSFHLKMLESLGVSKIVLDHCVTLSDIEELVKKTKLSVEVFCQLGCSFMQYTCSLYHSGAQNMKLGLPCRAKYKIKNTNSNIDILNTMEVCAICRLDKLTEAGVDSLKIVGRDIPGQYGVSLTKIYSRALCILSSGTIDIFNQLKKEFDLDWWIEGYCKQNGCKYTNSQYYI